VRRTVVVVRGVHALDAERAIGACSVFARCLCGTGRRAPQSLQHQKRRVRRRIGTRVRAAHSMWLRTLATGETFGAGRAPARMAASPWPGPLTFAATEMVAGGEVAFEAMKVEQLKAELAERGSTRSGRKAILQRRLHALLVQDAIERCGENMDV
jgi:hypothetical protein